MNGLNIFTSNHLEILADQLAEFIKKPLAPPLDTEIIVVQSRGMERWISMELARRQGICANIDFPFPNTFLQLISRQLIPQMPEESPFEPGIMTFKIMKMLPACIDKPGFETLKTYLAGTQKDLKLFQLSEKISHTFDQYLVFRPEMIFKWESGHEDHWQAQLWRQMVRGKEKVHRAWLRKRLFKEIKNRLIKISKQPGEAFRTNESISGTKSLPQRVSVFGISYLPPFYLQVFAEVSHLIPVGLFLMNPCREYWADIVSDREIKRIRMKYSRPDPGSIELHLEKGNRLLASMGAQGRDFFDLISSFDCEINEIFKTPAQNNILACIQSDILNLNDRGQAHPFDNSGVTCKDGSDNYQPDTSIQIHSCHSPMREMEVLHNNLLSMFEADPDLLPKDVIVMTPDIESYASFVRAVFDTQTDNALRIPFSIADQSVRKESRIVDGFLAILDLKNTRFGIAQVMALLEFPGIKEKFNLSQSDIDILEHWIRDIGIRWGWDSENRMTFDLPGFPENTWKTGIQRLLLGYALPGMNKEMFAGILPYDHIEGDATLVLGKFLDFLHSLAVCIQTMDQSKTLIRWNTFLNRIIKDFFLPDENTDRELQMLQRTLDDISRWGDLSGFDEKIELEAIRSCLTRQLDQTYLDSGFISRGVTFAAMLPMRSIPFKVICLVGMNNDLFPRELRPPGFDLLARHPKPGDRSRRNDDKYLFLETVLSARQKLYISYVGQSIQDNTLIPPSVLVSELIDYIDEGFGRAGKDVITHHRLQSFSPAYFKKDQKLFSYSREDLLAATSRYNPKEPVRFISELLPMSQEEYDQWRYLDVDTLVRFMIHPTKYLLQKRLGIYLEEGTPVLSEKENFELDALEQYQIGQDLLKNRLEGLDLKDLLPVQRAMGQLPHGNVGEVFYKKISIATNMFANRVEIYTKGKTPASADIDIEIDEFKITGRLSDIYSSGYIHSRFTNTKPKDLLRSWIHHLVLGFSAGGIYARDSVLICKDAAWIFHPVENYRDALKSLLALYWKGLSEALHFFPVTSYEFAQQLLVKDKSPQKALQFAQKKWIGSEHNRGESEDPYYRLCFRRTDPLDDTFQKIAKKNFGPILEHCREVKHLFDDTFS
jgi:exodeoxyribonuclease V gamma subunit